MSDFTVEPQDCLSSAEDSFSTSSCSGSSFSSLGSFHEEASWSDPDCLSSDEESPSPSSSGTNTAQGNESRVTNQSLEGPIEVNENSIPLNLLQDFSSLKFSSLPSHQFTKDSPSRAENLFSKSPHPKSNCSSQDFFQEEASCSSQGRLIDEFLPLQCLGEKNNAQDNAGSLVRFKGIDENPVPLNLFQDSLRLRFSTLPSDHRDILENLSRKIGYQINYFSLDKKQESKKMQLICKLCCRFVSIAQVEKHVCDQEHVHNLSKRCKIISGTSAASAIGEENLEFFDFDESSQCYECILCDVKLSDTIISLNEHCQNNSHILKLKACKPDATLYHSVTSSSKFINDIVADTEFNENSFQVNTELLSRREIHCLRMVIKKLQDEIDCFEPLYGNKKGKFHLICKVCEASIHLQDAISHVSSDVHLNNLKNDLSSVNGLGTQKNVKSAKSSFVSPWSSEAIESFSDADQKRLQDLLRKMKKKMIYFEPAYSKRSKQLNVMCTVCRISMSPKDVRSHTYSTTHRTNLEKASTDVNLVGAQKSTTKTKSNKKSCAVSKSLNNSDKKVIQDLTDKLKGSMNYFEPFHGNGSTQLQFTCKVCSRTVPQKNLRLHTIASSHLNNVREGLFDVKLEALSARHEKTVKSLLNQLNCQLYVFQLKCHSKLNELCFFCKVCNAVMFSEDVKIHIKSEKHSTNLVSNPFSLTFDSLNEPNKNVIRELAAVIKNKIEVFHLIYRIGTEELRFSCKYCHKTLTLDSVNAHVRSSDHLKALQSFKDHGIIGAPNLIKQICDHDERINVVSFDSLSKENKKIVQKFKDDKNIEFMYFDILQSGDTKKLYLKCRLCNVNLKPENVANHVTVSLHREYRKLNLTVTNFLSLEDTSKKILRKLLHETGKKFDHFVLLPSTDESGPQIKCKYCDIVLSSNFAYHLQTREHQMHTGEEKNRHSTNVLLDALQQCESKSNLVSKSLIPEIVMNSDPVPVENVFPSASGLLKSVYPIIEAAKDSVAKASKDQHDETLESNPNHENRSNIGTGFKCKHCNYTLIGLQREVAGILFRPCRKKFIDAAISNAEDCDFTENNAEDRKPIQSNSVDLTISYAEDHEVLKSNTTDCKTTLPKSFETTFSSTNDCKFSENNADRNKTLPNFAKTAFLNSEDHKVSPNSALDYETSLLTSVKGSVSDIESKESDSLSTSTALPESSSELQSGALNDLNKEILKMLIDKIGTKLNHFDFVLNTSNELCFKCKFCGITVSPELVENRVNDDKHLKYVELSDKLCFRFESLKDDRATTVRKLYDEIGCKINDYDLTVALNIVCKICGAVLSSETVSNHESSEEHLKHSFTRNDVGTLRSNEDLNSSSLNYEKETQDTFGQNDSKCLAQKFRHEKSELSFNQNVIERNVTEKIKNFRNEDHTSVDVNKTSVFMKIKEEMSKFLGFDESSKCYQCTVCCVKLPDSISSCIKHFENMFTYHFLKSLEYNLSYNPELNSNVCTKRKSKHPGKPSSLIRFIRYHLKDDMKYFELRNEIDKRGFNCRVCKVFLPLDEVIGHAAFEGHLNKVAEDLAAINLEAAQNSVECVRLSSFPPSTSENIGSFSDGDRKVVEFGEYQADRIISDAISPLTITKNSRDQKSQSDNYDAISVAVAQSIIENAKSNSAHLSSNVMNESLNINDKRVNFEEFQVDSTVSTEISSSSTAENGCDEKGNNENDEMNDFSAHHSESLDVIPVASRQNNFESVKSKSIYNSLKVIEVASRGSEIEIDEPQINSYIIDLTSCVPLLSAKYWPNDNNFGTDKKYNLAGSHDAIAIASAQNNAGSTESNLVLPSFGGTDGTLSNNDKTVVEFEKPQVDIIDPHVIPPTTFSDNSCNKKSVESVASDNQNNCLMQYANSDCIVGMRRKKSPSHVLRGIKRFIEHRLKDDEKYFEPCIEPGKQGVTCKVCKSFLLLGELQEHASSEAHLYFVNFEAAENNVASPESNPSLPSSERNGALTGNCNNEQIVECEEVQDDFIIVDINASLEHDVNGCKEKGAETITMDKENNLSVRTLDTYDVIPAAIPQNNIDKAKSDLVLSTSSVTNGPSNDKKAVEFEESQVNSLVSSVTLPLTSTGNGCVGKRAEIVTSDKKSNFSVPPSDIHDVSFDVISPSNVDSAVLNSVLLSSSEQNCSSSGDAKKFVKFEKSRTDSAVLDIVSPLEIAAHQVRSRFGDIDASDARSASNSSEKCSVM